MYVFFECWTQSRHHCRIVGGCRLSVVVVFVCISAQEWIKKESRHVATFNIRAAGPLLKVVISVFVFEKESERATKH